MHQKLEEAKLISINKKIVKKRPNTTIKLTALGKSSIENHWKQLEALHKKSKTWKYDEL